MGAEAVRQSGKGPTNRYRGRAASGAPLSGGVRPKGEYRHN